MAGEPVAEVFAGSPHRESQVVVPVQDGGQVEYRPSTSKRTKLVLRAPDMA